MSRLLPGRRTSNTHVLLKKARAPDPAPAPPTVAQNVPAPSPATNKAQEKQVNSLVVKIENKLPCNSGHTLSAVEADQVMEHAVVGLVNLAAASPCPDYIVWALCRLLEKLHKRAFPNNTLPESVLDSQLYILKTLTRVLNARWTSAPRPHPNPPPSQPHPPPSHPLSAPPSQHFSTAPLPTPLQKPSYTSMRTFHTTHTSSTSSSAHTSNTGSTWMDPPPLDDGVAAYALECVLVFLKAGFNRPNDGGAGAGNGSAGGGSGNTGNGSAVTGTGTGNGTHAHVARTSRSLRPGPSALQDGSMYAWDAADWEPALFGGGSGSTSTSSRRPRPLPTTQTEGGEDGEGGKKDKDKGVRVRIDWEQPALPVQGASSMGGFGAGRVQGQGTHAHAHGSLTSPISASTHGSSQTLPPTPSSPSVPSPSSHHPSSNTNSDQSLRPDISAPHKWHLSAQRVYTMYAHEYARDVGLHGSYLASVAVLVTKYASRITYTLSASNWGTLSTLIRTRLRSMVENTSYAAPPLPSYPSSSSGGGGGGVFGSGGGWGKRKEKGRPGSKEGASAGKHSKGLSEGQGQGSSRPAHGSSGENGVEGLGGREGGSGVGGEDDAVELRLLSVCVMDRVRLVGVLQELISLFPTMTPHAQDLACVALRAAVLNWVHGFPREVGDVWEGRKKRAMDGVPERMFDMLMEVNHQYGPKRAPWLWPALASLIVICPERLEAAGEALEGGIVSKKNNFLTQLRNAAASPSLAEHAAIAHLDIVRAAFVVPPSPALEDTALRCVGVQLAGELKRYMLNPPDPNTAFFFSSAPIDINFFAYTTAAIFRFHPAAALQEVMHTCLEPTRSPAVKLAIVKALVLMVVEAPKYPWQPSLESTYAATTPRMRGICMALLAGRAEIVGGIPRPAASLPVCRSVAQGDNKDIDEDVRLLLQIETLFTLEPAYWLYGTTDEDHGMIQEDAKSMLGPNRDKRAKAATMMALCAMLTRTLNIKPETPWYPQAMRYLLFTVPSGFVSVPLLLLNAGGDDHEFHRMGAACLHSMLMEVANGSPYEQDNSWRFSPFTMGVMPLVEVALWAALSSSQMDISAAAQRCLRLISVIERNPLSPPAFMTPEDFSKRCAVLEGLGDPRVVIPGRVAFLKRICKHIAMMSSASPTYVLAFRQFLHRWTLLTPHVDHKRHGPGMAEASKDEFYEWQNKMCIMAVGGGFMLTDEVPPFPPNLEAVLPGHLQGFVAPSVMVRKFVKEMVALLDAETLQVREAVKDALANDLSMRLMPLLVETLTHETERRLAGPTRTHDKATFIFAEQVAAVLCPVFDRMDGSDSVFENASGDHAIMIAEFVSSLPVSDTATLRLRSRFCATMDAMLGKRHLIAIRDENQFRNRLVDILATWISHQPHQTAAAEAQGQYRKAAVDAHIASLKTFVRSVETMQIDALEHSSTEPSASRQFHRYLTTLVRTLVPSQVHAYSDDASEHDSTKSAATHVNEALVDELVVTGIASLLNKNIEAGVKHCLGLCYDADFRLRVVLMKAFTRVLNLGTKFNPQRVVPPNPPQVVLCELLRDCEMILSALVEACPSTDVDRMVPVLLHVFNTHKSVVYLMNYMIDREVKNTVDPTQLFRANGLCVRLLSVFARQQGYVYLRTVLNGLIARMMELPIGVSFELDPQKLPPGESLTHNFQAVTSITQAFLDVITESVPILPDVLRHICNHISETVLTAYPESKFTALGAFIFLRFLCPAIVSPETVDIDISYREPRSAGIQRGLIMVAKIIQNLANNILFQKEQHLFLLNPFLEKNVLPVTHFLSSARLRDPPSPSQEETTIGPAYDDTDSLVLHRFFQAHMDKIGNQLLGTKEPIRNHSQFSTGKDAWDALCAQLVEMGTALEAPSLSSLDSANHIGFKRFMDQHSGRNTDALGGIFADHESNERSVFVFTFAKIDIDILDFELLLYQMFQTVIEVVEDQSEFDVVFDFTGFTARSELPVAWLKLGLELLPSDIRSKWRSVYILNLGSQSQGYLRKILYIFSSLNVSREITAVSSVAELQHYLGHGFMIDSQPATLERQNVITFRDVEQQVENMTWTPVSLHIGELHLRITSAETHAVSPHLSCRTVDVIQLHEIEDIYKGYDYQVVIRRVRRGQSITLASRSCENIIKAVQAARNRAIMFKPALLPTSQVSDLSATLLAIGLLHACHPIEYIRGAAYELLTANCIYMGYPFDSYVPWRGSFVPANSMAFIVNFSDRVAKFAPKMTLDFIQEWAVGFASADPLQKTTCLQYMSSWLPKLDLFFDPNSAFFDPSGAKVRDCINIFVKITLQEHEINPIIQRAIWVILGKSSAPVIDIVVDELMRVAVESGSGSRRCELVADTLIALSSIHTRAKVLTELRKAVGNACDRRARYLTDAPEWKSIAALSRLALVAGHSTRLATLNQLYAPELAHLITMLAATGSLTMRTSIYGMATNLLQALHVARAGDDAVAVQIRLMLDDLASPESLKLFGLNRIYPSSEISLLGSFSDQISVESLEEITSILLRALDLGSATNGLQNTWRARWMSLVTMTAFQAHSHSQTRAFTILGILAGTSVDDDIFYQMLRAFVKGVEGSLQDGDTSAALSMLRCMRKAVPGLPLESRNLGSVFWLALSLIQAGCTVCYGEAVQLLQTTIETMDRRGGFNVPSVDHVNPVVSVLSEARMPLLDAAIEIDEITELSFETNFGFALVTALWRGARTRADVKLVREVMYTLSHAAVRAANPEGQRLRHLDDLTTPLFMALAPFEGKEDYGRLLERVFQVDSTPRAAINGDQHDYDSDESISLFPLRMPDASTIALAIALVLTLDDSYHLDLKEKENVHFYWAEFAKSYPDLFTSGISYVVDMSEIDWISHKMETLFSLSFSPAHLQAITTCFDIVMYRSNEASYTTLGFDSGISQPSYQSLTDNSFAQALADSGMMGAIPAFRTSSGVSNQRLPALGKVPALLKLIIAQC